MFGYRSEDPSMPPPEMPPPDPAPEEPGPDTGEGEGAGQPDLPPIPPPPPSNTPLSITGSFARPGSTEARPLQTDAFLRDRLVGEASPRSMRFGAGAPQGGMGGGMDPDMLAAIMAAMGKGGRG